MTRSPLHRACMALRLPAGLYLDRGNLPLSDAEIRANLRQVDASAEHLVLALADALHDLAGSEDAADVWPIATACAKWRGFAPSMIGVLVALAMLPEEGAVEPDEWALVVKGAP